MVGHADPVAAVKHPVSAVGDELGFDCVQDTGSVAGERGWPAGGRDDLEAAVAVACGVVMSDGADGDGQRGLGGLGEFEAAVTQVLGPVAEQLGLWGQLFEVQVAGRDDEQQVVPADERVERGGEGACASAAVRGLMGLRS